MAIPCHVEDGIPTLSWTDVEGRCEVHVFLIPGSQGCAGWICLGNFALTLISSRLSGAAPVTGGF